VRRARDGVAAVARDPFRLSVWLGGALVAAGFGAIALAWRGAAALLLVPLQIPYLISGGLAGLGLIVLGLVLLNVQAGRRLAAERRRRLDRVIEEATGALERLRS
jgi:hypothetical protein